jgi:cell division cycle 2-like
MTPLSACLAGAAPTETLAHVVQASLGNIYLKHQRPTATIGAIGSASDCEAPIAQCGTSAPSGTAFSMSSKPASRWASSKEDAEHDARIKKEKEEKRRRKAEKARKLEEEKQAAARLSQKQTDDVDDEEGRPSKRRKLTPERTRAPQIKNGGHDNEGGGEQKLLRFDAGGWSKCRSVENYDKLNDIEEGTYGWVARATHIASGRVVALKRLKLEPNDRSGLPVTGLREIQILKDCKHRNVVELEEVVVGDRVSSPDK